MKFREEKYFKDTPFHQLMQNRVTEVLLVCSVYDAFMLEEDGRIDDQIFQEYAEIGLRYPPRITRVPNSEKAFSVLSKRSFDLVITMLNVGDTDAFNLAREIKQIYPKMPVVVLTPFSREVSLFLEREDISGIDHVFCWLGNTDILLAIIKLIEDSMNIEKDTKNIGVQAIIIVEDSIRYYSSYLPIIYKMIIKQVRSNLRESLNEHQKSVRLRSRPKILLAKNYEDAKNLYDKYKDLLLGIISDITFDKDGVKNSRAGVEFAREIRQDNTDIPILLQSSQPEFKQEANELHAGFLDKHSGTLLTELSNYVNDNFGMGDFIFKDPATSTELARAKNIQELQDVLVWLPDSSFEYHIHNNHFSRWLRTRALFSIANIFLKKSADDFNSLPEIRHYILESIKNYRQTKSRGVVADFNDLTFDKYTTFYRIGEGLIGGKARGLAFIDFLLKNKKMNHKYENVTISIPQTIVLATDIFDEFMQTNNLYNVALSDMSDDELLEKFIEAEFPEHVKNKLRAFIKATKNPLAVRSSSLLEDSHYQPFAGVYSTYMIPNSAKSSGERLKDLVCAIKNVYASTFYKNAKEYMKATRNVIDEEKMGVIIQQVTGKQYENSFYPTFSGVARSLNFYPISGESAEEGVCSVALGLGKIIVDGGVSLRYNPNRPKRVMQLSKIDSALKSTQTKFFALNMNSGSYKPSLDEADALLYLDIQDAMRHDSIRHIASTYDHLNHMIRDSYYRQGPKIITFSNILKNNVFPLSEIVRDLLKTGATSMNKPVEIEFAVQLDDNLKKSTFNVLQIRPIVKGYELDEVDLSSLKEEETIITSNTSLGNGVIKDIYDIIYVKPEAFDGSKTKTMAENVEKLNKIFVNEDKNYILVGPGRWGTSDPWLGIPVKWSQISNARVIVEAGLPDYIIEPSQGSHFFQNLTSFRVAYFTIYPFKNDGYYDIEFLNSCDAYYEDDFIRQVRFDTELKVKINGKSGKGAILKP